MEVIFVAAKDGNRELPSFSGAEKEYIRELSLKIATKNSGRTVLP